MFFNSGNKGLMVIGRAARLILPLILAGMMAISRAQAQTSADDYLKRGLLRQERGDLEGATADYDKAIEISPRLARAYNNRGVVRCRKSDFEPSPITPATP